MLMLSKHSDQPVTGLSSLCPVLRRFTQPFEDGENQPGAIYTPDLPPRLLPPHGRLLLDNVCDTQLLADVPGVLVQHRMFTSWAHHHRFFLVDILELGRRVERLVRVVVAARGRPRVVVVLGRRGRAARERRRRRYGKDVDWPVLEVRFSTLDDRLVFLQRATSAVSGVDRADGAQGPRTMSNSSSFSGYSMFSSSSSKPVAYALQFSVMPVVQTCTSPRLDTLAIKGRIGCH